jgi:hypothetical protein
MMAAQSPPLFTRRLETTKFTVLLLALLLLFLVHPFLDVQGLRRVLPVLFSAVLLSSPPGPFRLWRRSSGSSSWQSWSQSLWGR